MAFQVPNLDGLFGTDDPCMDRVLPGADWGAQHPDEIGRGITTAVTAPLGIGAALRGETALDSARTLGDWAGGVGDQTDLNHQLGMWAGPPLAALGAWGACQVGDVVGGWGISTPDGPQPLASSDAWAAPGDAWGANPGNPPAPAGTWSPPQLVDAPSVPSTLGDWQSHMAGGTTLFGTNDTASSGAQSAPTDPGSGASSGGAVSDAGGGASSSSAAASAGSSGNSGGI